MSFSQIPCFIILVGSIENDQSGLYVIDKLIIRDLVETIIQHTSKFIVEYLIIYLGKFILYNFQGDSG